MDLYGRVALVTGAGLRLGREIALSLARAGADIVVHYGTSVEPAEEVAAMVRDLGRNAWALGADLAEPRAVDEMFDEVSDRAGRLDVLVNSAATFDSRPMAEVRVQDWERTMAVNLRAPFFCMQRAAELMTRAESDGVVVNIADLSGLSPWIDYAVHGASKAGLVFLTESAARELGPAVRVNAVVPGAILPPPGVDPEGESWAKRGDELPLRRTGAPEHVVKTVLFLIDNDFVTGAVVPVDGGERLVGLAGR